MNNQEKKEIKKGDIFHCSWGYNMTHNDFYKVIDISKSGSTLTLVKLQNQKISGDGWSGRETYTDLETDIIIKKRLSKKGKYLKINSFSYADHLSDEDIASRENGWYYNYLD